jgi:hypothetical protein
MTLRIKKSAKMGNSKKSRKRKGLVMILKKLQDPKKRSLRPLMQSSSKDKMRRLKESSLLLKKEL